ncbi:MAG: GNAT family N-acetyltransferase [Alphaproteobacteria bacterium]|nr:GNAT family N-acetyltransferase [Alphaproteobacteria bacterium]
MSMNNPDLEIVRVLEQHSARCWPATFVDSYCGWEIRRTPDVSSGRVNSVNAIAPESGQFDQVLVKARALFDEQEEWPLIRIHPLAGEEPVQRLEALGLHGQGDTVVKTLTLFDAVVSPTLSCLVRDTMTPDWMIAYGDAHDTEEEERQAIARTLSRVTVRQAFAVFYDGDRPVASGRGAVADGWVGLFQISTVPKARRRGFGQAIVGSLLAWGREAGASQAYLQVEVKNDVARRLYRSFGFEAAYVYSYWWLPDDIELVNPTPNIR